MCSKAATNALLSTKQNLISDRALTIPNISNLQTELNARPLTSNVYTKTEGLTISNITNLQNELNTRPLSSTIYSKTETETMIAT